MLFFCFMLCVATMLQASFGQPPVPPTASSSVAELIGQLDGDEFAVRKRARRELVKLGVEAVQPVTQAVLSQADNRELQLQGLEVLQNFVEREGSDTSVLESREAAIDALIHIVEVGQTVASERTAKRILVAHSERVAQQATIELRDLGAIIGIDAEQILPLDLRSGVGPRGVTIGKEWGGSVGDLKRLALVPSIVWIKLEGPEMTDEHLVHVARVSKLEKLEIKSTKISAAGITILSQTDTLKEIVIRDTRLPDGDKLAAALQGLSAEQITLHRIGLDRQASLRMVEIIPPSKSKFRFGAFLGVGASANNGCRLHTISDASAARLAGIHVGDVITKFDGKEINDFEQLRDLIGLRFPGDVVQIEVQRLKHSSRHNWIPNLRPPMPRINGPNGQPKNGLPKKEDEEPYEILVKELKLGELAS